jgi:predicted RNA polymerase sigma factor
MYGRLCSQRTLPPANPAALIVGQEARGEFLRAAELTRNAREKEWLLTRAAACTS